MKQVINSGLASQRCPVTGEVMSNMTRSFDGFHISYARYLPHYGCDTTALVLNDRVFLILNGYHADDMVNAAVERGIQGCIDIFIDRIQQANNLSEHDMAVGLAADPFELYQTTVELIGQQNIDRLKQAIEI